MNMKDYQFMLFAPETCIYTLSGAKLGVSLCCDVIHYGECFGFWWRDEILKFTEFLGKEINTREEKRE